MSDWNEMVIAQFRENRGYVEANGFGKALVLLHHRGARSGEERVSPVFSLDEDEGRLIVASAAGSPKDPDWMHNLRAHPDVTIEVPARSDDGEVTTEEVRAVELTGPERDAAYQRVVDVAPGFADYEKSAGDRVIPVVRLLAR